MNLTHTPCERPLMWNIPLCLCCESCTPPIFRLCIRYLKICMRIRNIRYKTRALPHCQLVTWQGNIHGMMWNVGHINIGECASGKWMAKQVQGRHMHRSSLLFARRRAGFQKRLCSHAEVCSFRNSVRAGEVDGLIRAKAKPLHGYRTTTASKSPKSPNSSTSTNLQMCSHP